MLFDPSEWLSKFMQLTQMSWDFKSFILGLGIGYITLAWTFENYVFTALAKYIGVLKTWITRTAKQRKTYKIMLEQMQRPQ
jgi:cation-transporting ATPase 13A2